MRVIGLTGGIATGKSTVSEILKNAGAVIIDADRIARGVVKKNLPAYRKIVETFGESVLLPDGEINRKTLGHLVFNDPRKKKLLNASVHPLVRRETNRQLKALAKNQPDALVILDIPLLFEADMRIDLPEVIVVYAPEHVQIRRLIQRDGISQEEAMARIRSQMPIEEKKSLANMIIDNSGTIEQTRRQTLEIFQRLKDRPR